MEVRVTIKNPSELLDAISILSGISDLYHCLLIETSDYEVSEYGLEALYLLKEALEKEIKNKTELLLGRRKVTPIRIRGAEQGRSF